MTRLTDNYEMTVRFYQKGDHRFTKFFICNSFEEAHKLSNEFMKIIKKYDSYKIVNAKLL